MSETSRALLMKFAMTFVFALLTLWFFDTNNWVSVLLYAIVATAVNYLVGDLYVLPNYGNVTATLGDSIMAVLVAYLGAWLFEGFRATFGTLVALAILVGIGEYYFHNYLRQSKRVKP